MDCERARISSSLHRFAASPRVLLILGCVVGTVLGACTSQKPQSPQAIESHSPGARQGESALERPSSGGVEDARARVQALLASRSTPVGTSDYAVGPGDVLKIAVFDVPELDRTARVAESGEITLPLIGSVEVAGLTVQGVHDRLTALLGHRFVVDPQVDVRVETFASQRVAVMGRVEKPGVYSLSRSASRIVDLVGQAGGVSAQAARRIELYPVEERPAARGATSEAVAGKDATLAALRGRKPIVIDLFDLMNLSDPVSTLALRDGDVVFVPDQGNFFVGGEVKRPGKYGLSETSTLITAIAEAGGLGDFPISDDVLLVRHPNGADKITMSLDFDSITTGASPDVAIEEGDQVIVQRSMLRAGLSKVVETMGRFIGVGLSAPL